ncbi:MAG TPA: RDD family protein [Chloroflexia bacterium]|nr:RDD family protein [Chloroflexia bacterium]
MVCPGCGAKNLLEARYCYNCGAALVQVQPEKQPPAFPPPPPFPTVPAYQSSPYAYSPVPTYSPVNRRNPLPANSPVLQYHPLAEGVVGLPREIEENPMLYYSYVNRENRLVFARRVGFSARLSAMLLDLLIIGLPYVFIASFIVAAFTSTSELSSGKLSSNAHAAGAWVWLGFFLLIYGYFYLTGYLSGQSFGKRLLKMRVMKLDGQKPDRLTAAMRFLFGYSLSTNLFVVSLVVTIFQFVVPNESFLVLPVLLTIGWGFWWVGFDRLKEGWHDKLARTLVVDTRELEEGKHFFFPQG